MCCVKHAASSLLLAFAAWIAASPVAAQGTAAAQQLRLEDRIEAPLLYLALDAPRAEGVRGESQVASKAGERASVHQLLADPALDLLFGSELASTASGRALTLVRGVLARSSGELELAMTSVVPASGQPLLVFRARLQPTESQRLQGLLDGPDLATPHRSLGGQRTWSLRSPRRPTGPGELVELSLVGDDLLVANDMTAMEELLVPPSPRTGNRTSAGAPARQVLAADPRYTSLKRRMSVAPGALLLYGDWQRLGQRLQTSSSGLPAALLEWSGMGSAQSVMASVSVVGSSYQGTLLLDFDLPRAASGVATSAASPIDGWLAAALPVPARTLVADLPGAGFGGLVLAVDLADVARRSHRGQELIHELRHAFHRFGLDFERNVLGRLGTRGTVQMLFRQQDTSRTPEIVAVYAVRAKNRKAAADLFADLRRASEQRGNGRMLSGKELRGIDILELRGQERDALACLAVHEDQVVIAFDPETVATVVEEQRRAGRQRGKRDVAVTAAIAGAGVDQVAGLFDLDLGPWLEQLLAPLHAAGGEPMLGARLPKRHIGAMELQPRDGGVVLRVSVVSSQ